jgi:hypothetical protein
MDSEVMVRVYGVNNNLLGVVTAQVDATSLNEWSLLNTLFGTDYKLNTVGTCKLKLYKGNALKNLGLQESESYEAKGPVQPQRAMKATDITGLGPMLVGLPPLPENLQGVWWLTDQGKDTGLMSFGGPNDDGEGCNTGFITGAKNTYKIRAHGDRTVAFADPTMKSAFSRRLDAVFTYQFNDDKNPTFATVAVNSITGEEAYRMTLEPTGDPAYPNSKVWVRLPTSGKGQAVKMVQIINGQRQRIEPAFTAFSKYMASAAAGGTPGWMFYDSRYPSPSVGAVEMQQQAAGRTFWKMLFTLLVLCVVLCCCIPAAIWACCLCCRKKHRKRTLGGPMYSEVDEEDHGFCSGGACSDEDEPMLYQGPPGIAAPMVVAGPPTTAGFGYQKY